jgi:6-bladed beta-propeller
MRIRSCLRRPPSLFAALCCALVLAACGRDAGDGWRGTMETLPGGTVLVRNPEQGAWGEGEGWTAREELRIGTADGEGPALFGDVAALEVDALGRVWVLERQAKELRVFDAAGRHVRTIGREGGGPGEFRDPIGLAWAPDGRLWVADPQAGRFTVFDTAGGFVASHPRRVGGYSMPWRGGFGADGRLQEVAVAVSPGSEPRQALLRFDSALAPVDTVLLPLHRGEQFDLTRGNTSWSAGVPFTPGLVFALAPDGAVWTGVNDRYRFVRLGARGDTTRIVEREAPPVPVTAAERDEAVAELKWFTDQGGRVDAGRIPDQKPAFQAILVDSGGGIWVRPSLPAGEAGAAFDVFDAEGRYQGRLRLPGGMSAYPPPVIRGGALYGVARDSLDVPAVVRVRIVRGG